MKMTTWELVGLGNIRVLIDYVQNYFLKTEANVDISL